MIITEIVSFRKVYAIRTIRWTGGSEDEKEMKNYSRDGVGIHVFDMFMW